MRKRTKLLTLIVVIVACLGVAGTVVTPRLASSAAVRHENYLKVNEGMTKDEVIKILGSRFRSTADMGPYYFHTADQETLEWDGPDCSIEVAFREKKPQVVLKKHCYHFDPSHLDIV